MSEEKDCIDCAGLSYCLRPYLRSCSLKRDVLQKKQKHIEELEMDKELQEARRRVQESKSEEKSS